MNKQKAQQKLLEDDPEVQAAIKRLDEHFDFLRQKSGSGEFRLVLPGLPRPKKPGPNQELFDLCEKYGIGGFKGSRPFLRTPFEIHQDKDGRLGVVPLKELNKAQWAEAQRQHKSLQRQARLANERSRRCGEKAIFAELKPWLSRQEINRRIVKTEFNELVPKEFLENHRKEPGEKRAAKSKAVREIAKRHGLQTSYIKKLRKS